jgi:hypothetical protein
MIVLYSVNSAPYVFAAREIGQNNSNKMYTLTASSNKPGSAQQSKIKDVPVEMAYSLAQLDSSSGKSVGVNFNVEDFSINFDSSKTFKELMSYKIKFNPFNEVVATDLFYKSGLSPASDDGKKRRWIWFLLGGLVIVGLIIVFFVKKGDEEDDLGDEYLTVKTSKNTND